MGTVTPAVTGSHERSGDAGADSSEDTFDVGARVLQHFLLEELLDRRDGWSLFLADNEARSDLVLLVIAISAEALANCLAGPAQGAIVSQTAFGSWHVAEVALDEAHLWLYREKFLRPKHAIRPTLPSATRPAEQRLEYGTLFDGRYRIEKLLGRGGMGEVYCAEDRTFQRRVAVKVVRVDTSSGEGDHEQAKRRLLNEARVVSALKHPHIVEIYDAGECDGLPYLALELCGDGGNLRNVMKEETSENDRLKWLCQIAEALAYAHEHGIVHRDVKPENVLLTSDKNVKVADFGIAKALRSERAQDDTTFGIVGTPRYMAPEQLFGRRPDARVDQFAWGIVAYELLTGVHPHANELALLRSGDSTNLAPALPPHLRRVLMRATANDPAARYPNFHKLLMDLNRPPRTIDYRWIAVGFSLLAGIGALGYSASRATSSDRGSAALPSSSASLVPVSGAPRGSEADGLLEQGIQLWADGSSGRARALFARIAAREPNHARAHLLAFIASERIDAAMHDVARAAFALRGQLAPAEASLLEALRPLADEPPDVAASTSRIEELGQRYPNDRLIRLARAEHALRAREPRRALDLAASMGSSPAGFWLGAAARLQLGDVAEGRKLLEQCIDSSPSAIDCLEWLTILEANDGRCGVAEKTARKLIAKDSSSPLPYSLLAFAVLAQTNSIDATRGILQSRIERAPPEQRREAEAAFEHLLHVYEGDFAVAYRDMNVWQSASAASSDAFRRGLPFSLRIELDLELERLEDARRAASEFAYRSEAWLANDVWDVHIEATRLLYATRQISRAEFHAARDKTAAKQIERGAYLSSPGNRWFDDYVEGALDATDAAEAIAAMPADPVIDLLVRDAGVDARLGHIYLLAGRLDDAIPFLKRAASSCTTLEKPLDYVHGLLWLGEALDQKGNHAEACNTYAKVVERWGREPRSVTVRRARTKLLSCP